MVLKISVYFDCGRFPRIKLRSRRPGTGGRRGKGRDQEEQAGIWKWRREKQSKVDEPMTGD